MSLLPCSDNSSSHYTINFHRIITLFTLHNIHTISTHRICTISAHYLHNIFTISAHYLRRICTISAQYLHNICTVSAQYLHTIYTQNLHNIYTLSAHYLHDIYSLPAVPPSLPRLVCSPCSAPRPPGRWEEDTAGPGRGDTSCFHIFCQPTLGCAKKSDNNYPIMVVAQTESQPCSILGQPKTGAIIFCWNCLFPPQNRQWDTRNLSLNERSCWFWFPTFWLCVRFGCTLAAANWWSQ